MYDILVIESSGKLKEVLLSTFTQEDRIIYLEHKDDIFEELKSKHHDIVFLDLSASKEDAFDLLGWINSTLPNTPVIVTSQKEEAEIVVKTIKRGAFDFIAEPFSPAKIRLSVQKALDDRSLRGEIDYLRHEQDIVYDFDKIIAFSSIMKDVISSLRKFAKTDTTILMTGETGTGKSFLSGSIHFNGHRCNKPFVKINCSNIPETLLESELFGHEKGAFTGADRVRIGRFEQAQGGTIFLDEIGELGLPLQGKLLRVLEEKAFERVGGNTTIHSDVRVIAATNRVLEQQIIDGKFREDLYYRINVLTVKLPPLRERKSCIEPLAYYLLEKVCRTLRKKITGFSHEVMDMFVSYTWPGNIRQLANTIERAAILTEDSTIRSENISLSEAKGPRREQEKLTTSEPLQNHERALIIKALEDCHWIQKDAAEVLGISPRSLNYKIKKFGITHSNWKKNK